MLLSALYLSIALSRQLLNETTLTNPDGGNPRAMIQWKIDDRLDPPKVSPKLFGDARQPFEFDYYTGGFGRLSPTTPAYTLRFCVYEQQRKATNDLAVAVTHMLLRLWEFNYYHLKLDHSATYHTGLVDVYLCWGGTPGGEQLFDEDKQISSLKSLPVKVNTIYIYDLPSFKEPVEMAREVAHEYGHATLPPVGGFQTPEDWGNGYLGERLFLTYLRDEIAAGKLQPEDALGATKQGLDTWVSAHVDPLVVRAASAGPDNPLLGQTGQEAMNAYMGLMLYAYQLLPEAAFARSLKLIQSTSAKDIPQALVMAVDQSDDVVFTIPARLSGQPIWVPVSTGKLEGASVLQRLPGWALIKAQGPTVTLHASGG